MLNAGKKAQIDYRRERVAQLSAQGMTTREIAVSLSKSDPPIVADDGSALSHVTIAADLKAIKKLWRKASVSAIDEHIARQLAEIQEAKRDARRADDLSNWTRLETLEIELLGTKASAKIELTGARGGPVQTQAVPPDMETLKRMVKEKVEELARLEMERESLDVSEGKPG